GGSWSLQHGSNTCQLSLARFQCSQGFDASRVKCLAFEPTGLDNQLFVDLGELREALCGSNCIALNEGDSGRTGKLVIESFDAGFLRCDSGQGVLHNGVLGLLTKRAAQILELCNGKPTVFGQDSRRRIFEVSSDLFNRCSLARG